MDNKSDSQLLIIKATIEAIRNNSDKRMKKITEDLTAIIISMIDQNKIQKYSLENKDKPKPQEPTTVISANKSDTPLEGGHSTEIGCMWTLKHEIISPKFYEILIKT